MVMRSERLRRRQSRATAFEVWGRSSVEESRNATSLARLSTGKSGSDSESECGSLEAVTRCRMAELNRNICSDRRHMAYLNHTSTTMQSINLHSLFKILLRLSPDDGGGKVEVSVEEDVDGLELGEAAVDPGVETECRYVM